MQKKMIVETCQ
jgi:P-type E1-E2 ATPase